MVRLFCWKGDVLFLVPRDITGILFLKRVTCLFIFYIFSPILSFFLLLFTIVVFYVFISLYLLAFLFPSVYIKDAYLPGCLLRFRYFLVVFFSIGKKRDETLFHQPTCVNTSIPCIGNGAVPLSNICRCVWLLRWMTCFVSRMARLASGPRNDLRLFIIACSPLELVSSVYGVLLLLLYVCIYGHCHK